MAKAHDFEVDGIYYKVLSNVDKTVEVTYRGDYASDYSNEYTGSVVIPDSVTYDGTTYSVTSIGESAFRECSGLTSITIPNSVTSIGEFAFAVTGLTNIRIPNSVTNISNNVFGACTKLVSAVIPNGITTIAKELFYNCPALTSIEIPNSVTSIGERTFAYCTGLTSITIPNSVTSIERYAFNGCSNVETLYIGGSVASIGGDAFAGCEKITEIKVALEKPIRGSADIFAEAVYDNATLYVPTGTEPLYQELEPWNIFFNIVEMDFTGIENVKAESGKVQTIYDLNGRAVENPSSGIYIIDGKKVLVK